MATTTKKIAARDQPAGELVDSMPFTPRVLVVDDGSDNVRTLQDILSGLGEVLVAADGDEAIGKAQSLRPDLILLDVAAPDRSGYDLIDALKSNPLTEQIPVMVITALDNADSEEEGLRRGAIDYIAKPYHPTVVKARVRNQLTLRRYSLELERLNQELDLLARTDPLTGCYNRRHFMERGREELSRVKRYSRPCCLMVFDLDHFKPINDRYGHEVGDDVLKEFVRLMQVQIREQDTFGRLGGEEFGLLMPETTLVNVRPFSVRLFKAVRGARIQTDKGTVAFSASCGAVALTAETASIEQALGRADKLLYEAKAEGRDRIVIDRIS